MVPNATFNSKWLAFCLGKEENLLLMELHSLEAGLQLDSGLHDAVWMALPLSSGTSGLVPHSGFPWEKAQLEATSELEESSFQ